METNPDITNLRSNDHILPDPWHFVTDIIVPLFKVLSNFLFQNLHSQGPMCRALCAVEMLSLQNNGLPEFTGTCPTLPEVSPRFMLFETFDTSGKRDKLTSDVYKLVVH